MYQRMKLSAWLSMLCLAVLVFLPSAAFAAPQTVEADGYYTVGDGLEENHSTAKLRAKEAAKGRAAEQAAVLVEKSVSVKNHQLTASEIRAVAATVMKITEENITPEVEGNTIRYHCHIVAVVDDGNVMDNLLADKKRLMESELETEDLRKRNEALAREMEELKQKMKNADATEQRSLLLQSKSNDKKFQATQWREMGNQMLDAEDYDGALASYRKAVSLDPQYADAYIGLGAVYGLMKDFSKSLENAKQALTLDPDSARAYMAVGFAYFSGGDYAKAADYIQKSIALGLDYAAIYGTLGLSYFYPGRFQEAIPNFEKAISMDPDNATYYTLLGFSYGGIGNYEKSIACLNKGIELDNTESESYYARGLAFEALGRRKEAKRDFAKAYELEPSRDVFAKNKQRSEKW